MKVTSRQKYHKCLYVEILLLQKTTGFLCKQIPPCKSHSDEYAFEFIWVHPTGFVVLESEISLI